MMRAQTTRPTVVALSLALALTLAPATPAQADNVGAIATSSVVWDSIDSTTGVLRGGTPQIFDPAHGGWRSGAFDAIGEFGIEITPNNLPTERKSFSAWNELTTLEQGGTTTLTLSAQIISDTVTRNLAEPVITVAGNSARFDIHIEEFWPGSLVNRRVFFFADLAAGNNVVYESLTARTLLATDSTGVHPAVLLSLSSSAGDAYWARHANHQVALTDGDDQPTAYVANIPGTEVDLSISAFIIDGDPCADEQMRLLAQSIASDIAGSLGTVLDTPSACLSGNAWSALTAADQPQELIIDVDSRVTTPEGSTRRFALGGQPAFLSTTIDESKSPATVTLGLTEQASPGDYPLTLTSWLETGTTRSQPMTQLVTLSLTAPPPPPEPEPEPEPVVPLEQVVTASPEVITASTGGDESTRKKKKREEFVPITQSPLPVTPALPPRATDSADEPQQVDTTASGDPQYRLQESAPATPLPAPPQPEQAELATHEPAATLWTMWWLWVIAGLALLWWAWLGWHSRRSVGEGM